jgi:DnaJ-like protein
MAIVLEFDGVLFFWEKQALGADQLLRWLRWRRPGEVELCWAGRRLRMRCEDLEARLLRPDLLETAYRTLGLPRGSDGAAIRRAWRRLARLHHPDRGGSGPRMQEINAAYRLLRGRYP